MLNRQCKYTKKKLKKKRKVKKKMWLKKSATFAYTLFASKERAHLLGETWILLHCAAKAAEEFVEHVKSLFAVRCSY